MIPYTYFQLYPIMSKECTKISPVTRLVTTDHFVFYHKLPGDNRNGVTNTSGGLIRHPEKESHGYRILEPYYPMPKARLAETKEGPILVVRGVDMPSADSLLLSNPEAVSKTIGMFTEDTVHMWEDTLKPMDESKIARNWRQESITCAERLLVVPEIKSLSQKKLFINGREYPNLEDTLIHVIDRLQKPDPVMVQVHGDEHVPNLLVDIQNKSYMVIDPGNYAGLNTPASVYNNMMAGLYIFGYEWEGEVTTTDEICHVNYEIKEEYKKSETILKPALTSLAHEIDCISGGDNLRNELYFVNTMRCSVGWIRKHTIPDSLTQFGLGMLGLAVEQYYEEN